MLVLKYLLKGIVEITIGVILLLIFSFCLHLGSSMTGEKAIETQEFLYSNDLITTKNNSIVTDTTITVQDTVK